MMNNRVVSRSTRAAALVLGLLALGAWSAISARAADKVRWVTFKSNLLSLQVSVPEDWKPAKIPKALAFRFEDLNGTAAAIGILKSDRPGTIEAAADNEFQVEGHPTTWTRTPARVDGKRAIKIVGVSSKNPDHKFVHYYIEAPAGTYIVQCQAPADRWATFSPIFAKILGQLKFL